jgi:hypothetical protein
VFVSIFVSVFVFVLFFFFVSVLFFFVSTSCGEEECKQFSALSIASLVVF